MSVMTNLLSGLIGSVVGGVITGLFAIQSVRRTEYYRLLPGLKRVLRETEAELAGSKGTYPLNILDPKLAALKIVMDDVIPFAGALRRRQIIKAWQNLAYESGSTYKDPSGFPSEYTRKGTIEARELMLERIRHLLARL